MQSPGSSAICPGGRAKRRLRRAWRLSRKAASIAACAVSEDRAALRSRRMTRLPAFSTRRERTLACS